MKKLDKSLIQDLVDRALAEDIQTGDITTAALIDEKESISAEVRAKEDLVLAGLPVAEMVFTSLDGRVRVTPHAQEGDDIAAGRVIALVEGPARAILTGERTALNFLQHLSGVASAARKFVEAIAGTNASILDTRKTMPGLRYLQKYAVAVGGAMNHRMGLYDKFLIKDNHLAFLERYTSNPIGKAVTLAREKDSRIPTEIEAKNIHEVEAALTAKADFILLDNMSIDELREAMALIDDQAYAEASGGITIENVREVALTGVHYISIGCITHSVKAVDISLDMVK
jgi:nicotinate-nucleotide pyrophosphorylase (carboxylating)